MIGVDCRLIGFGCAQMRRQGSRRMRTRDLAIAGTELVSLFEQGLAGGEVARRFVGLDAVGR